MYCIGKGTVGYNEESWRDEAYICQGRRPNSRYSSATTTTCSD